MGTRMTLTGAGAGGPAGPPFTPTQISGLLVWVKADAQVFNDAGTTPAINGQTVQQWNDQSGSGKNLTQATAGNRPTFVTGVINGLPVVRFSQASSNFMVNTTLAPYNVQPSSTFAIVNWRATTGANQFLCGSQFGTAGCLFSTNPVAEIKSSTLLVGPSASFNTFYTFEGVINGASASTVSLNGGTKTTGSAGTSTEGQFEMGSATAAGSSFGNIDVLEFLIYNSVLSAGNEALVLAYLRSRGNHY